MEIDKHEELYAKFINKLSDQDKDFYLRMVKLIPFYKRNYEHVDEAVDKTWQLLNLHTSKIKGKPTIETLREKLAKLIAKNKELK